LDAIGEVSDTSSDESSESESEDMVSLHAKDTEEYGVEEVAEAPAYQPTSKKRKITEFLRAPRSNVSIEWGGGGRKFDTSVPTLKADPESLLNGSTQQRKDTFPGQKSKIFRFVLLKKREL
jgi:hypothetical protein